MKQHSLFTTVVAYLLSLCLASATLTATVSPGYQFSTGEQPTTDTLNLLGLPSILISGTVDGTTGLTPGSVNGVMLANSVVDGVTIGFNAASPRQEYVLVPGLVNTNSGLVAAGNNSLQFYGDTNFFTLATNSPANTNSLAGGQTNWVTLTTAASGGGIVDAVINSNAAINMSKIYAASNFLAIGGSNNTLTPLMYDPRTLAIQTYTNVTITTNVIGGTNFVITVTNIGPALVEVAYAATVYGVAGTSITNSQGGFGHPITTTNGAYISALNPYSAVPSFERWVLVCLTNNNGYVSGDELDARSVGGGSLPAFAMGASATNVWLTAAGQTQTFINKTNGVSVSFNPIQWNAKAYLKP